MCALQGPAEAYSNIRAVASPCYYGSVSNGNGKGCLSYLSLQQGSCCAQEGVGCHRQSWFGSERCGPGSGGRWRNEMQLPLRGLRPRQTNHLQEEEEESNEKIGWLE